MPLQATSGAASYDGFGGGAAAVPQYIEDVFSTYLYTGNGSTQTITNGIDLSTKGGLVWSKRRNVSLSNLLFDTVRGNTKYLVSNTTGAEGTDSPATYLTSFNSNGFSVGAAAATNNLNDTYASWTFRKQPKFFDVVTYTGNGAARTIAHSLGSVPGCVLIKCTSLGGTDWMVFHRSASTGYLYLNSTSALMTAGAATFFGNGTSVVAPDATSIYLGSGDGQINQSSATYVAYLFAHDAGGFGLTGTDNVISCGSYTGNGSATGPVITLGYEPQFVMIKNTTAAGNWVMLDVMRGLPVGDGDAVLYANVTNAETSLNYVNPLSTGFQLTASATYVNTSGSNYIYIAIRRGPMKVPTSGTSVFTPVTFAGDGTTNRNITGFQSVVDLALHGQRDGVYGSSNITSWDRLRGAKAELYTGLTDAEATRNGVTGFDRMNSLNVSNPTQVGEVNQSGVNEVFWGFRRAPSFFDEVCYTGTGSARTINHNLGVTPELMIVKRRDNIDDWGVYAASYPSAATGYFKLNTTQVFNVQSGAWNNTAPTASVFTVGNNAMVNASGGTYVAYLFATCAGVSKVGSYTGTGTGNPQTIDCGFTAGARFVLIRKTSATGSWWVWDSARGIVASVDPYLALEQTFAENFNGTSDSVDTHSTGFIVNENAQNNVNSTGATYIFLAIA